MHSWEPYHRSILDESVGKSSNLLAVQRGLRNVPVPLPDKLILEVGEALRSKNCMMLGPDMDDSEAHTPKSCVATVTKRLKSSHPAFRLIEFGTRSVSCWVPLSSTPESSNIVPA